MPRMFRTDVTRGGTLTATPDRIHWSASSLPASVVAEPESNMLMQSRGMRETPKVPCMTDSPPSSATMLTPRNFAGDNCAEELVTSIRYAARYLCEASSNARHFHCAGGRHLQIPRYDVVGVANDHVGVFNRCRERYAAIVLDNSAQMQA